MGQWAQARGESNREVTRWVAVGYLHDVVREADPASLRDLVGEEFRDLPDGVLHGPGCAVHLRRAGVVDEELLQAITYHTLGHPALGCMGRGLYAADFLEPGRRRRRIWCARLRALMPDQMDRVVREIAEVRIRRMRESGVGIRVDTEEFYSRLTGVD